ncbi:hypothetical protein MMC10_009536 [Thelotrema lepadinum]|nr:hypothetical protein [Thelotrema lepadinum]
MDWSKKKYNEYYTSYMPWVEDKYLQWFGENKTSYSTKETLKTDVTGDKNLNAVQGGLAEGVGGQFSKGGLLGGVGEATSKEGFNRAERGDTGPVDRSKAEEGGQGVTGQAKDWGNTLTGGVMGGGSSEKK